MTLVYLPKKVVFKTQSVTKKPTNVSATWDTLTKKMLVGIQRK